MESPSVNKTHVVVTCYRPAIGSVVMHAYGPYSEATAKRERRRILAEFPEDALRSRLHVSACKVLDVPGDPDVPRVIEP